MKRLSVPAVCSVEPETAFEASSKVSSLPRPSARRCRCQVEACKTVVRRGVEDGFNHTAEIDIDIVAGKL